MSYRIQDLPLVAFAGVVIDRFLKALTQVSEPSVVLVPGILRFESFYNDGIAFSLPFRGPLLWILSAVIIFSVAAMAVLDARHRHAGRLGAYALFVFGAASNFYDRLAYGHVVDYLIFFGRSAVNLADGMILAGAVMLLSDGRRFRKASRRG